MSSSDEHDHAVFWPLEFDERDHGNDLRTSIERGEITCIVDEEAGGIIAYVLGDYGKAAAIALALNQHRHG